MRALIGKLGALLTPAERARWLRLVPLMVISGAIETIATGMVFVLIKIAGDPHYAWTVEPLKSIFSVLPWKSHRAIVLVYCGLIAGFFVLRSLLQVFVADRQARAASETGAGLSTRLLDRYLRASYTVHLRHTPSELAYNATNGVDHAVTGSVNALVALVIEVLVSLGLAVFLVIAAPVVTLASGLVLGSLIFASLRLTKRASRRFGQTRHNLERGSRKQVEQCLGGLREIKVLRRERVFHEAFAQVQQKTARAKRVHSTMMVVPRLSIETIFVCSVVVIVAMVMVNGDDQGTLLPLLGLYAYAGFRLIPSANRCLMHIDMLRGAAAALDRVVSDMRSFVPDERLDAEPAAAAPLSLREALRLEGVGYKYETGPRPVLSDIDLVIRRGQAVGIVGPTGAGKSTLIDLILGLLDPTEGRITVDGAPMAEVRPAWQRSIGYVPQVAFLFDDTIRRNVALGIPEEAIDDARVKKALAMAQLEAFVQTLPDGVETLVGERGVRFSGGQRQRVAIARALYHEPELLVFDEATAALDNATERDVTKAIELLRGQKTIIIIAHRLSTVRRCDTLVFLRDGRIAGTGSYDRLLEENVDFRDLALAPVRSP
jgi:ABC-type multidrug transport system fused ATPase/permease subunit